METIRAHIGTKKYKTTTNSSSGNILIADEPVLVGGQNLGFSPFELLASSLASCIAITLRMYADRKNWNLTDAFVEIDLEKTKEENTLFKVNLKLFGDLDHTQRENLLAIAKKCPVHKALLNTIEIETNIH